MIISGFPGTGKSTCTKLFTGVVDLESTPFKKNWAVYADVAEHMHKQGYLVLVSSHKEMREELLKRNLPFTVVIPHSNCKDEFIRRYKERGNTDEFIKLLDSKWGEWIDEINFDIRLSVEYVDENTYIEDIINKWFGFKISDAASDVDGYEIQPVENI